MGDLVEEPTTQESREGEIGRAIQDLKPEASLSTRGLIDFAYSWAVIARKVHDGSPAK